MANVREEEKICLIDQENINSEDDGSIKKREIFTDDDGILYDTNEELTGNALTKHEYNKWKRMVFVVSYISIVFQLAVGVSAIVSGLQEDSSGTFGFGIESMMDILTTVVVLWRFHGEDNFLPKREKTAVIVLSILMILFSIGVIVKAIYNVTTDLIPFKEVRLMIICTAGFSIYIILAWTKLIVSMKIKSTAVFLDAISSFAATGMAIALLLSLIVFHFTSLWFLDSIVGGFIAMVTLVYGSITLYKSCRKSTINN